jgi:hypothetical protein
LDPPHVPLGLTLPDGVGAAEEAAAEDGLTEAAAEDGLTEAAAEDGLTEDGAAAADEAFDEGFTLLAATEADGAIQLGRVTVPPLLTKYARWAPAGIVVIGH